MTVSQGYSWDESRSDSWVKTSRSPKMMETYYGCVRTPSDAIKLFEACRLGLLPRVQRRLSEKERQSIRSGSVFVWDEREAGMRRWTDGKSWSASRVSGSFLTYREMEGKRGAAFPPTRRVGNEATPESNRASEEDLDDGEIDGYRYKIDGLMKQSFSITTSTGQHLHLISYFSRPQAGQPELPQPCTDPSLRHIVPAKGMYPESSIHETQGPALARSPMEQQQQPPPPPPHHQQAPYHPPPAQQGPPPPHHPHGYPPPPYAQPGYAWPPSPVATPPYNYGPHAGAPPYAQPHPHSQQHAPPPHHLPPPQHYAQHGPSHPQPGPLPHHGQPYPPHGQPPPAPHHQHPQHPQHHLAPQPHPQHAQHYPPHPQHSPQHSQHPQHAYHPQHSQYGPPPPPPSTHYHHQPPTSPYDRSPLPPPQGGHSYSTRSSISLAPYAPAPPPTSQSAPAPPGSPRSQQLQAAARQAVSAVAVVDPRLTASDHQGQSASQRGQQDDRDRQAHQLPPINSHAQQQQSQQIPATTIAPPPAPASARGPSASPPRNPQSPSGNGSSANKTSLSSLLHPTPVNSEPTSANPGTNSTASSPRALSGPATNGAGVNGSSQKRPFEEDDRALNALNKKFCL